MAQTTMVSFFTYRGFWNKWKAFQRMGFPPLRNANVSGLQVWKPMGVGGGNGFSIRPDFSTYALITIFTDEPSALEFYESAALKHYSATSVEHRSYFMHCMHSHGEWGGKNPFQEYNNEAHNGPVAIITRATIKPKLAYNFWKYVPSVSRTLAKFPGLIFSKGFGEWPIFMQATFSVWEDLEKMKAYAYQNPSHAEMIKMTRLKAWYSEEMFSRFQVWDQKIVVK